MTTIQLSSPVRPAPTRRPLTDVRAMVGREFRRMTRSVDVLITALVLPVSIMLVFVVVFGGAIEKDGQYVAYVVPAILILCTGFGSAVTAVSVSQDMHAGIIDRFKTMPIFGSSVLVGHVIASVFRNLVASVLVMAVAIALGFRPAADVLGWVEVVLYLAFAITAFTWVCCAAGMVLSEEAANGVNIVFLFVPYLSNGFVSADSMPGWLQGFSKNQPFTPIIETVRALLNGTDASPYGWLALAWLAGFLAVGWVASVLLFRRRVAK